MRRQAVRLGALCATIALAAIQANAGFVYDFHFTTTSGLGNTGVDGEVTGYFALPDATMGIINDLAGALLINELVVTSDTTGTGFAPIGVNLLTYSDPVLGIDGWELYSSDGFVADGTTASGQLAFSAVSGGGVGGERPFLAFGLSPSDSSQRVGIITWNPDLDQDLGNRKTAAGSLQFGDTVEISAASSVPEPSGLALLGMGVAGVGGYRWRRKRLLTA